MFLATLSQIEFQQLWLAVTENEARQCLTNGQNVSSLGVTSKSSGLMIEKTLRFQTTSEQLLFLLLLFTYSCSGISSHT